MYTNKNLIPNFESIIGMSLSSALSFEADSGDLTNDGKSDASILFDTIIKPHMSVLNNDNTLKLMKSIIPHHGELAALMSTPGPQKKPRFTAVDEDNFIKASGISSDTVAKGIGQCCQIKSNFLTLNNRFMILIVLLIAYHYKKKTVIKDINVGEFLTIYLGLRLYKNTYGQFFKHYEPNADVMAATIDGLDSNRFLIKKFKSIYKTIEYISKTHYNENFTGKIEKPTDDNVLYYFQNLYNRIHLMMKGIANAYYENHKKGVKTGTATTQSDDEEGESYMNNVENVSSLITSMSRKIFLKFISDTVANPAFLKVACDVTGMSTSKMLMTVNKMLEGKEPLVENLIVKMLTHFFTSGGQTIQSAKFINEMIKAYKVSNTSSDLIKEIKDILDKIMKKYSKTYLQTSNVSTLSKLKFTLYIYIILYIVDVA